jgi:hypothetical protein
MFYRNETNAVVQDNTFVYCNCGQSRGIKLFDRFLLETVIIATCDKCYEHAPNKEKVTDAEILSFWGDEIDNGIMILNGDCYELDVKGNVREDVDDLDTIYRIVAPNGETVGYEATKEEAERKAREMQGDDILNETQCDYWVTWEE